MEIKPNSYIDRATRVAASPVKARPPQAGADSAAFGNVEALNEELRATPCVRPEVVAQAQQLISDVNYPPPQIIEGIANLCALDLDNFRDASAGEKI